MKYEQGTIVEEIVEKTLVKITIASNFQKKGQEDQRMKNKQRRTRMTKAQLKILEVEFQLHQVWSYDIQNRLANDLGMERVKIYKWNYDRINRKKLLSEEK